MDVKYVLGRPGLRKCWNCGARTSYPLSDICTCSYCGASYSRVSPNTVVMRPLEGVLPITLGRRIVNEEIRPVRPMQREHIRREMARELAELILDKIDFSESLDNHTGDKILEGKIRILDKNFCFDPKKYEAEGEDNGD